MAEALRPIGIPPMLLLGKLVAIAALVVLNAFFVACEFAIVKVRTSQLDALSDEGNLRAEFRQTRSRASRRLPFRDAIRCDAGQPRARLDWRAIPARMLQPVFAVVAIVSRTLSSTSISFALAFIGDHFSAHRFWRAGAEIHCDSQSVAGGASSDAAAAGFYVSSNRPSGS